MSLHIPDILLDLGPPHSFWCFAFERMNGFLAGLPKSNRNIETEVMNKLLHSFTIYSVALPIIEHPDFPPGLKDVISSSDDDDDQEFTYPQTYWVLSALNTISEDRFLCQQTLDKGDVNHWPVKLIHPSKMNVRVNPNFLSELRSFFEDLYGTDLSYVHPRINKFGRCLVNGITFSSDYNSTDRGSVVKAMFVDRTNELVPYFGIVRYYFTANAVIEQESKQHTLSYVSWLKFRSRTVQEVSNQYTITRDLYQSDHIISPRRFLCRCTLISTKPTDPFFFVSELPK